MNTTATSIPPHAFLWLRMLICSVHPSVLSLRRLDSITPNTLLALLSSPLSFSSSSLSSSYSSSPVFFSTSLSCLVVFYLGTPLSSGQTWTEGRREREIKREEIKTEGLRDTKEERDEWVMEMKIKFNRERGGVDEQWVKFESQLQRCCLKLWIDSKAAPLTPVPSKHPKILILY